MDIALLFEQTARLTSLRLPFLRKAKIIGWQQGAGALDPQGK
jgi:hypothetical protein